MLYIWLAVLIVAVIVEASTTELVSIWFAIGAIPAIILACFPAQIPFWVSIIVFFVVSAICFAVLRPLASKYLKRKISKSNVDELVGKKGLVTKDIKTLEVGEVRINDVFWTGVSSDESVEINKGEVVEVVSIKGNKLIVKKVSK